ncbi:hypothetical protein DSM104443_04087 [Usitatibacter rugosus]|uniref:Uncharacterized protein n=1 Tax=Usitatibacter rugosus TaxID=2732067 RepID=A0A6M4H2Q2_9PROT|nr:hypothetical protein [Usitatibacter rugosus]QJR12993.1 hypothetical protein DSM104443_04087 [Usitatibacter rugosus]
MPLLLAAALLLAAVDFAAFPPDEPLVAPAAKPIVTGPAAKFATQIREAAKQPADFNGHFKIARWGCGSNCLQWAVIDQQTGRVVMAPRTLNSCAPGGAKEAAQFPDWLDYRADSRLIVAYECEDPKNGLLYDTRRFYALQRGALVALRMERLKGELGAVS